MLPVPFSLAMFAVGRPIDASNPTCRYELH
jgi:hypothetical protein